MKEFMEVVIFKFHESKLEITGVDSEKVVLLQTILISEEEYNNLQKVCVAAPLLDVYKLLRSCGETDSIIFTIETLPDTDGKSILTGRLVSENRNTWYRFPFTHLPMDLIEFAPGSIEVGTTLVFPTKLIQRSFREIVHSQHLLKIQLDPVKGFTMETFNEEIPGAGGGKTRIYPKDPTSHIYSASFLVRYLQKFMRIVPTPMMNILLPCSPTLPLQVCSTGNQFSIRLVISPYNDE